MFKEYLIAIEQHCFECVEDLNLLSEIAQTRSFNRLEKRAAERSLQVLIEACIGVAKYWLKVEQKHQPIDTFNKLAELQKISLEDLKQWRKIIEMRNALVHDYLTIDSELLHLLLKEHHYIF
jgi:uncharacterized protein YutE (UPF0331/DUF86 family)